MVDNVWKYSITTDELPIDKDKIHLLEKSIKISSLTFFIYFMFFS